MQTFDVTCRFETPELEATLTEATRLIGDFHTLTAIVRNNESELGELYADDETFEVSDPTDWVVTGNSIWDIAEQLRKLA